MWCNINIIKASHASEFKDKNFAKLKTSHLLGITIVCLALCDNLGSNPVHPSNFVCSLKASASLFSTGRQVSNGIEEGYSCVCSKNSLFAYHWKPFRRHWKNGRSASHSGHLRKRLVIQIHKIFHLFSANTRKFSIKDHSSMIFSIHCINVFIIWPGSSRIVRRTRITLGDISLGRISMQRNSGNNYLAPSLP